MIRSYVPGGRGTIGIKCDVELDITGPGMKVTAGWTAKALREVAKKLEDGEYEDGHHEISDRHGKGIGSVCFDFHEID
ncbi:hypothetical protein [Ruegeria atlantica]|uniref:hypothetical protein n=1 Tax=Ruegeria atlantica TaxID=81569 RepID=UPI00147EA728|nr:hypothetical protein [Ruegeria atlantica]